MTASDQSRKRFLKTLVNMYGSHPLWTDGAQWYSDTWKSLEHYRYKGYLQ